MDHPPLISKHPRKNLLLLVDEDICTVMAICINTFLDQGVCPTEPNQPALRCLETDGLLWGDAELRKGYRVDMLAEAMRCDLTGMMICQEIYDHLFDKLITEPGLCGPRDTSHFFWQLSKRLKVPC